MIQIIFWGKTKMTILSIKLLPTLSAILEKLSDPFCKFGSKRFLILLGQNWAQNQIFSDQTTFYIELLLLVQLQKIWCSWFLVKFQILWLLFKKSVSITFGQISENWNLKKTLLSYYLYLVLKNTWSSFCDQFMT